MNEHRRTFPSRPKDYHPHLTLEGVPPLAPYRKGAPLPPRSPYDRGGIFHLAGISPGRRYETFGGRPPLRAPAAGMTNRRMSPAR